MATIDQTPNPSYTTTQRPSALDHALNRLYTLNWEMLIWGLLLVLAIVTRFYDLGVRVMSHDESLHTHYSWELYDFGKFEHTPLMHGPVLFHAVAFFYFLFGPSDFSARIYPALLGVLLIMFPLLFRRWMGKLAAIFTGVILLISPMSLYYNRYIREDTPNIFFMVVMVYAFMQYIDGKKPRQVIWIAVCSGSMLLMLASKEVAFMYIAIFGSFLTLFWILRMLQDIQITRRRERDEAEILRIDDIELVDYTERPSFWLHTLGHAIIAAFSLILGYGFGAIIYEFYAANHGFLPSGLSNRVIELATIILVFILLESVGLLRRAITRRATPDTGWMLANGLRNIRPAMLILTAGMVLGGVFALWLASMLEIIKTNTIFVEVNNFDQLLNIYNYDLYVDETALWHFVEWGIVPLLFLGLLVVLIGILKRTPWQDIAAVLLVALVFTVALIFLERHSHPAQESLSGQPVAVDPNAESTDTATTYNNIFIYASWIVCSLIVMFVLITRLFTNIWEFMNRQPVFDVLIVMGSMIFPWLAAFPLFWAGYVLDQAPEMPSDTINAAFVTVIAFLMVSTAVGLAWNWRVWPVALAVFAAIFLVFFTTFFTNGYGVATGLVGSLGYWLEQQDVRRGSQPQYYYIFLQMPIYEYLPMILGIISGFAGLSWLFDERGKVSLSLRRLRLARQRSQEDEILNEPMSLTSVEHSAVEVYSDTGELILQGEVIVEESLELSPPLLSDPTDNELALIEDEASQLDWPENQWLRKSSADLPNWALPYDHSQEISLRRLNPINYLGGLPFLQLLAYWAIMILVALTIAGEKMPWLTIHMTIPLAFLGGWYTAHVVEKIQWEALRRSGWVLLLFVLPVLIIGLAQIILPLMTGVNLPFQSGQTQVQLKSTGQWMAAFIVVGLTGYFALRIAVDIGWNQWRRIVFGGVMLFLAMLTVRTAWMFAYINYDLPTEFGVYAHGGEAPKDVLEMLTYMAERHPDGWNMKIAYDDDSSWPMLWYLRDFNNKIYFWGSAEDAQNRYPDIEGAIAVIVGNRKNNTMQTLLGDDYYRFDMKRLWWPMQEYFHLNYNRIANVFKSDTENPAASLYRKGIWDIWWSRDYDRYGQAMCTEDRIRLNCQDGDAAQQYQCGITARNNCLGNDRFNLEKWPVSDELYLYIRKDFAVQIWDAGLDGLTVAERLIPDPEDTVYREIPASISFGSGFLNGPRGLASDTLGNLYVTDANNNRVVAYTSDGLITHEIGGRLFVDVDGSRYLITNDTLVQIGSSGQIIMSIDPATLTDEQGNLYTYDSLSNRLTVTDTDGNIIRDIAGQSFLREPWGIAVSPLDGNIYIADTWNHRVVVYTPEGDFVATFGQPFNATNVDPNFAFYGPRTVVVDAEGFVYVSDTGNHRIRVYSPSFQWVRDITGQGDGLLNNPEPVGMAIHPVSGELYIAETWNQRISVFRRDGTYIYSWPVNMWAGTRNSLNRPYLAISPDGTMVLVSDMDNSDDNNGPRVVAYDLRGNALISFNAPLALSAENSTSPLGVNIVAGLAFGTDGQLYVADASTSRIVVFPPLGVSGSLAPVPDPTYGLSSSETPSDLSDVEAVQQLGYAYWQSLSLGNYELFRSLYCAEDQSVAGFPTDATAFSTTNAAYLGVSVRELSVYPELAADTGTLYWGGFLIFRPGTEQESRAQADYAPFNVIKRDGAWLICSNAKPATDNIFRPGGG